MVRGPVAGSRHRRLDTAFSTRRLFVCLPARHQSRTHCSATPAVTDKSTRFSVPAQVGTHERCCAVGGGDGWVGLYNTCRNRSSLAVGGGQLLQVLLLSVQIIFIIIIIIIVIIILNDIVIIIDD